MMKLNRTNEPGTCLYCGKRLPVYCLDKRTLWERDYNHGDESADEFDNRVAAACADGWQVTKRAQEEPWNDRPPARRVYLRRTDARLGVYGDDLFHSTTCAAAFGRAMATNGYRLKNRTSE